MRSAPLQKSLPISDQDDYLHFSKDFATGDLVDVAGELYLIRPRHSQMTSLLKLSASRFWLLILTLLANASCANATTFLCHYGPQVE